MKAETYRLITHLISQGPQPNVKIKLALYVVTGLRVTKVVVDSDKKSFRPTRTVFGGM